MAARPSITTGVLIADRLAARSAASWRRSRAVSRRAKRLQRDPVREGDRLDEVVEPCAAGAAARRDHRPPPPREQLDRLAAECCAASHARGCGVRAHPARTRSRRLRLSPAGRGRGPRRRERCRGSNGPSRRRVSVRAAMQAPTGHPTRRGAVRSPRVECRAQPPRARARAARAPPRCSGSVAGSCWATSWRLPSGSTTAGASSRSGVPGRRARRRASASEESSSSTSGLSTTVTGRVTAATPAFAAGP